MHATRATTRSQHASRVIAALPVIATTFVMHAMVERRLRQIKMPRLDAYEKVAEKSRQLALEIAPDQKLAANDSVEKFILASCTNGKTFYANAAPIAAHFKDEDEFLDFSQSFEQGFVSAWTAKTARTTKLPAGVKRVRIAGLGNLTKRNGFRVVVAEVQTEDTSEAFRFFHLLRVDEKLEREDYLTDQEVKDIVTAQVQLEKQYPMGVTSWMTAHQA